MFIFLLRLITGHRQYPHSNTGSTAEKSATTDISSLGKKKYLCVSAFRLKKTRYDWSEFYFVKIFYSVGDVRIGKQWNNKKYWLHDQYYNTTDRYEVQYKILSVVFIFKNIRDQSKKISNDQELIQSDPTSCPQNQKGNN